MQVRDVLEIKLTVQQINVKKTYAFCLSDKYFSKSSYFMKMKPFAGIALNTLSPYRFDTEDSVSK